MKPAGGGISISTIPQGISSEELNSASTSTLHTRSQSLLQNNNNQSVKKLKSLYKTNFQSLLMMEKPML
jgi:hypothetical protein